MSQFKRFNASENNNWNTNDTYPQGTLTWDPDNGLRIHDGDTSGGNPVGGGDVYWGDIQNRPYGSTAVHDLQGGSSSAFNGYFLKQTTTGVSEWSALPTTYDTLTIDTKIIGGIDGRAGTQITGIEASLGSGAPYRYAFISGNDAFGNLFNRGSSLVGWKMYPASDPSAFVTITEFLDWSLGAPSLGFSGSLAQGPWVAESSDYSAGANGPLTLSANTKNWVLGTDGKLQLPVGGDIVDSTGTSVLGGGGSSSPAGAGSTSYSDVWVYSDKADSFWTSYSLTGNVAGIFGSSNLTNLSNQVVYGKQMSAGDKVLNINDHAIHTNSTYGVLFEFPSSPTVGDTFSTPLITSSTTVTAGSFVVGTTYTIVDPGTTNFMLIGAGGNYPGVSFVATGIGSGTGTASVSTGVGKAIYKPASGQKAVGMSNGQGERPVFGQGTNYIAGYIDVSSQMGGNPVVWVYAGVISSVPTWYQFYF